MTKIQPTNSMHMWESRGLSKYVVDYLIIPHLIVGSQLIHFSTFFMLMQFNKFTQHEADETVAYK